MTARPPPVPPTMDITPLFHQLLASRGAPPRPPPPHDPARLNAFLQEAYRIHGHVSRTSRALPPPGRVRAPYLALPASSHRRPRPPAAAPGRKDAPAAAGLPAPPAAGAGAALTDADRAAVERSTARLLSTLSGAVSDLSRARPRRRRSCGPRSPSAPRRRARARRAGAAGPPARPAPWRRRRPREARERGGGRPRRAPAAGSCSGSAPSWSARQGMQRDMLAVPKVRAGGGEGAACALRARERAGRGAAGDGGWGGGGRGGEDGGGGGRWRLRGERGGWRGRGRGEHVESRADQDV